MDLPWTRVASLASWIQVSLCPLAPGAIRHSVSQGQRDDDDEGEKETVQPWMRMYK